MVKYKGPITFYTFCPKINFSLPNITWDILYMGNLLGHPSFLHFHLYRNIWFTEIWQKCYEIHSFDYEMVQTYQKYEHVTHFVPNIRHKSREILPTRNLMGNGLTSECSDRYSLTKRISSVTNTRHHSHGNYLRATSEFSSKSLTIEG